MMEPPVKRCKKDDDETEEKCEESKEVAPTLNECDEMKSELVDVTENEIVHPGVTEVDVGITEYLGNHTGFSGTIKNRWEDFIVHEVSMAGEVVKLTSFIAPKKDVKPDDSADYSLSEDLHEKLTSVLNGETNEVQIPAPDDKDERTKLHKSIKHIFPTLCSQTVITDDKRIITISKNKNNRQDNRRSKEQGKFCQFVLFKEGKDTGTAISLITRQLGGNKMLMMAGTKDRRAITSQLASIKFCEAERLQRINRNLYGIKMGNFQYVHEPLKLGDLQGNRFTLVIRDVVDDEATVVESLRSLGETGFVNYFGLQRFGSSAIPTYQVGMAILKCDWQKAIDLILEPSPVDLPGIRAAKELYKETKDVDKSLEGMPYSIEKSLMMGIKKRGRTMDALGCLTRNLRQLYVHSYQSLIWNRVASRRIKELGVKPVIGDLVLLPGQTDAEIRSGAKVKCLTEVDLAKTRLSDVVLPLPGCDIKYPENQVASWYKEILEESGLDDSVFKHKIPDYKLFGSYRQVIIMPGEVDYEIVRYKDPLEPLVLSDLQVLNNRKLTPHPDGPHRAVILNFTLPKSVYATMAMRETMKQVIIKR